MDGLEAWQPPVRHNDGMTEVVRSLIPYAERIHRLAGKTHHVVSPLGAWLLLALAAPLAKGAARDELTQVLGVKPEVAGTLATSLLKNPHPLVTSAAAIWNRPWVENEDLAAWSAGLPVVIDTGDIPTQAGLDDWADQHTLGLIKHFPINLRPEIVLLVASALATKISWSRPFDIANSSTLGPSSPWSTEVREVLRTPALDLHHQQFVTDTERAGTVIVHTASARGGLAVTSVGALPDVPAIDVIMAAYSIATSEATQRGSVPRRSLFDLPIDGGPLWTISEEEVSTPSHGAWRERCYAELPSWEATCDLDLEGRATGFEAAFSTLADVLRLDGAWYVARQSAMARYSRVGFEAAAVTALAVATAAAVGVSGKRRVAELRFGHPYAVVAVVTEDDPRGGPADVRQRDPWRGVPVFSAWITEPSEAGEHSGL